MSIKLLLLLKLFFVTTLCLSGKSRLGEYYLGFGYGVLDQSDGFFEGESLNLLLNSPASESSDFNLDFSYLGLEANSSDETFLKLGLSYRHHFDQFYKNQGMVRPFVGLGLQYFKDTANLMIEEDGFGWSLDAGTELVFTRNLTFLFQGRLYGLWKDFAHNEFDLNSEFTWWFDEEHALSLGHLYSVDSGVNHFQLKYFYSWR